MRELLFELSSNNAQIAKVWMEGCGGLGFVELRIRDNGVGFQSSQVPTGLGIQIMHERTNEIGARLEIRSSVGSCKEVDVQCRESPQFGNQLL